VSMALIIWKALMCLTGSESPVVVVLSGSMEPAFKRVKNPMFFFCSHTICIWATCGFSYVFLSWLAGRHFVLAYERGPISSGRDCCV